jgi:hypothetical protein
VLNSVSLHNLSTQLDVAEEAQAQLSQVGVYLLNLNRTTLTGMCTLPVLCHCTVHSLSTQMELAEEAKEQFLVTGSCKMYVYSIIFVCVILNCVSLYNLSIRLCPDPLSLKPTCTLGSILSSPRVN